MKGIGWTLMFFLLLASFSKKVISEERSDFYHAIGKVEEGRSNGLTAVSKKPLIDQFFDEIFDGNVTEGKGVESTGRTFGVKRIQFMLMPIMYKMGAMMTLLTVLTVISLKGLLIGIILLVLKLSSFLAKFYSVWNQQHVPHSWSPQPIHVHVHNDLPYAHRQAYHGWETMSGPGNDEHYYYRK
ncbi:protein apnoia [Vespula pensylvanica]|uniref:protein apnoia n=1 Tax=Vespula pensylvanica TaxID=30213 RepID=UPI001CBA3446|nr:protein apnoia [Vespula pensylvanica]